MEYDKLKYFETTSLLSMNSGTQSMTT